MNATVSFRHPSTGLTVVVDTDLDTFDVRHKIAHVRHDGEYACWKLMVEDPSGLGFDCRQVIGRVPDPIIFMRVHPNYLSEVENALLSKGYERQPG